MKTKGNKTIYIIILAVIVLVLLLLATTVVFTQAKYVVGVSIDNTATVTSGTYGFKYTVENGICYVTSFTAQFQNSSLVAYQPTDTTLGSLAYISNRWVLTFPSSITISGMTYNNLVIRNNNTTAYGFPIYNTVGTLSLVNSNKYNTYIKKIIIPDGVTQLGYRAFYKYSALTEIVMSDTVTLLNEYALSYCTSLTTINWSDNLTTISAYSFYNSTALTNATIPGKVTYIGVYAFYNCTKLRTVYIPISVTTIMASTTSNMPFYGCRNAVLYCGASKKQTGWGTYWNYYASNKKLSVSYGWTLAEYEYYVL